MQDQGGQKRKLFEEEGDGNDKCYRKKNWGEFGIPRSSS